MAIMDRGLTLRIVAVYALVLALGAGFTWRIYQDSRALYLATVPLVEEALPVLGSLSALRASVMAQEPILYEYYATVDSARFRLRWQANRQAIADYGMKVRRDFPQHPRLTAIDTHDAHVRRLAADLDSTMSTKPVDWDQARALLEEISRHALEINRHLDNLAEDVHARAEGRGVTARASVDAINRSALVYDIGVFLLAAVAGYLLNRHLAGAFVRTLEDDPASATLVRAIVELGHSLVLTVIAEGVENQDQLTFLQGIGCEEAQGYWFSQPMERLDFLELVKQGAKGRYY